MKKEYKYYKTAKKTATENNLIFKDGNNCCDAKMLFDLQLLNEMDISEKEKELIKNEIINNCSISNSTAFVIVPDKFETCHTTVDLMVQKVYNAKTYKRIYLIFAIKEIKYFHGERDSIYEKHYSLNQKELHVVSKYRDTMVDVEI